MRTLISHTLESDELEKIIDRLLTQYDFESSSPLIPILQAIQQRKGYLTQEALRLISKKTGFSLSQVYGVATFYHQFRFKPEGKHRISVCRGTACHVSDAIKLYNVLVKELGITPPEDTSEDGLFTIYEVRCIGACSLAPIIKIDERVYGKMTPNKIQSLLNKYKGG
jgi:NADH-quinone oxidoreductase subunit E